MRKRLSSFSYSSAPPPSPIPTGKGSRSAADSILGEYIHQSVNVPHLTLPHSWAPDEIHYKSLLQRENDAMNRLLSSAAEFGVVRIIGHGISSEELRTMLIKNEWLFRLSEKYANYDKFLWDWSDNAMVQKAKVAIGDGNFLLFRQKLEQVLNKLKGIAKEVDQIIRLSDNEQSWKKIESEEVKMYIYRCTKNQSSNVDHTWLPPHNLTLRDSFRYALNLYLPLEPLEFSVHSKRGRLPFKINPDTIIVTIGDQLEEWSDGKFRSADGEVALKPNLQIHQALLSLELKWSFTNINNHVNKTEKKITLSDQKSISESGSFVLEDGDDWNAKISTKRSKSIGRSSMQEHDDELNAKLSSNRVRRVIKKEKKHEFFSYRRL